METIATNKKYIIIALMILTIIFCSVKLIPIVKENMREKQEIPLTQNFIDTFHENFEYGMTGEEIKDKLGEPSEIWRKEEIYSERDDFLSYEDRGWYKFAGLIQTRKGFSSTPGHVTQCYVYRIDIDGFSYAYFYMRDGYFVYFDMS